MCSSASAHARIKRRREGEREKIALMNGVTIEGVFSSSVVVSPTLASSHQENPWHKALIIDTSLEKKEGP